MGLTDSRKPNLQLATLLGVCLLVCASCDLKRPASPDEQKPLPIINKVVAVGFRPALPPGEKPEVIRSPLTSAVFEAEPVPSQVAEEMNAALLEMMAVQKRYELISPDQAKGILSAIAGLDSKMEMGPLELVQEVGKRFGADAVLAGYIYRWRERMGGDYAVERPASVSFGLNLVRPEDGAILWRGRFDKTQRSLSENIFDFETFIEGGGKWMTAHKLAMLGLRKLVTEMCSATRAGEE